MSDPNSRNSSESFEERAKRIAKEILKINNLRTLYATLRVELGAIKRQYPEWIKELEPLKPREDVFVEAFTEKILTAIREEVERFRKTHDFFIREIGVMVIDGQYEEEILVAKNKKAKFFEGMIKGLELALTTIEQIRSEA